MQAKAASTPERPSRLPARETSAERAPIGTAPNQQYARASSSGDLRARQQGSPAPRAAARRSFSHNLGDAEIERPAASSSGVAGQRSFGTAAEVPPPAPAPVPETLRPEADFLGFSTESEGVVSTPVVEPVHAAPQPSSATSRKADMPSPEEDLLNMSGEAPVKPKPQAAAAHSPRAPDPTPADDDLLGGFSRAPAAASAQEHQPHSGHPKSAADADIESLFGGQPASQHRAGASMIDFGDEASQEAAHVFADPGDADVEGEPEVSPVCLCPGEGLQSQRLLHAVPLCSGATPRDAGWDDAAGGKWPLRQSWTPSLRCHTFHGVPLSSCLW